MRADESYFAEIPREAAVNFRVQFVSLCPQFLSPQFVSVLGMVAVVQVSF